MHSGGHHLTFRNRTAAPPSAVRLTGRFSMTTRITRPSGVCCGDTAASVVASGVKVATLVTLDPVSYSRPNLSAVAANAGQWLDYQATGGGLVNSPNIIAGLGSSWINAPVGFANTVTSVNLDHGGIASGVTNQLLGLR
jgi:hypothetical protein